MNAIVTLIGGLLAVCLFRKPNKKYGIGSTLRYVITMQVPLGGRYYNYIFCGWDNKGYAIWQDPRGYRDYSEKIYKTLPAAEKAVQRIVGDGDGKREYINIAII